MVTATRVEFACIRLVLKACIRLVLKENCPIWDASAQDVSREAINLRPTLLYHMFGWSWQYFVRTWSGWKLYTPSKACVGSGSALKCEASSSVPTFPTSFWSRNRRIAEEVTWFFLRFLPGSPKLSVVYMWIRSNFQFVIYPHQVNQDLLRTIDLCWHVELTSWGSGSPAACPTLLPWGQRSSKGTSRKLRQPLSPDYSVPFSLLNPSHKQ